MSANCPSAEALSDYTKRIELLRSITEAKKLSSADERSQAVGQTATSNTGRPDLHAQTKARFEKEIRDELFGTKEENTSTIRQRDVAAAANNDVDKVIRHHLDMQERIAEEMVHLTHSLKENAKASGRVVRDDIKRLADSSERVVRNYDDLKTESDRLETHVKQACSSWILVMLVVVILTFVWMVLFMKMFPKT